MIENLNLGAFKKEYLKFKETKDYEDRKSQTRFVEIARSIIEELLKKEKITNEGLTALIQMFGAGCKRETFHNYLKALKFPTEIEEDIYKRFIETGETGYTGRGKAAVRGLDEDQLETIKEFLSSVSKAKTKDEIKVAYKEYRENEIPQVTSGVYSPWVHYLQPEICPVYAGPLPNFFSKISQGSSINYSNLIDTFEELKKNVQEKDLGLIDQFLLDEKRRNNILFGPIKTSEDILMSLLESKKQIILYGPPGTGKTYNTKEIAMKLIK